MSETLDETTSDDAQSAAITALLPAPGLGFHANIPEDDYHAMEGISQSTLKRFLDAPAKVGVPIRETKSMALGSLLHYVMTQGDLVDQRYHVDPKLKRIAKRDKAFIAAQEVAGTRTVITQGMMDKALRIRDAVWKQPIGRELLDGPMEIEQSFFWKDPTTGLLCRGRTDIFRTDWNIVIDLKSTADGSTEGCAKSIAKFGYDIQDPYYLDGWELAGIQGPVKRPRPQAFFFLFIESGDEPHLCHAVELDDQDRTRGEEEYRNALDKYAFCKAEGLFPGYGDNVQRIAAPEWTMHARVRRAAYCDEMIAAAIQHRNNQARDMEAAAKGAAA